MSQLFLPRDGIELAREIAWELELRPDLPTESDIIAAIQIMNATLPDFDRIKDLALLKALSLYELPDHDADVEMLEDHEVEAMRVEAPIVKGIPREYRWFGYMSFKGFG